MRLTVGPLPPAVYWRRRAVVLGSALLVVILLAYSCGGSGDEGSNAKNAGATTSPPPSSVAPSKPPATPSQPSAQSPTTASAAPAVDPDLCTDSELQVMPVPASQQVPRGATVQITLKIKNVSKRTCSRDVGADLQELYIVARSGGQKIWSSDDCGGLRGNNVESFPPNIEHAYTVNWNGLATTNCKDRPTPEAGEYQLYGRVGTKRSAPVTLTLT